MTVKLWTTQACQAIPNGGIAFFKFLFLLLNLISIHSFSQVDIIVPETSGIARIDEPVTLGLPFEQGQVMDIQQLRLTSLNGEAVAAQFSVMANWRDGSIRWAKCDFQASVDANSETVYQVHYDEVTTQRQFIEIEDNESRIIINTGVLRFEVNKKQYRLIENVAFDQNGDGIYQSNEQIITQSEAGFVVLQGQNNFNSTNVSPTKVEIEEVGPMKVVIKVEGRHYDEQGNFLLKYESRIYAFANQSFVKVRHSYANGTSVPSLGDSANEIYGESIDLYEISLPYSIDNMQSLFTSVDNEMYSTSYQGGEVYLLQKDRPTVLTPFSAVLTSEDAVLTEGQRADGWIAIQNEQIGIQFASRQFWEKYPKGLKIQNDHLSIQSIPSRQFLWAAMGTADEFILNFYSPKEDDQLQSFSDGLLRNPLIPYVAPQQMRSSGVFYSLYTPNTLPWIQMESYIQTVTDNHLANREALDLYGNLHFGDVPRDQWELGDDRSFSTWGSNYYDCILTSARLFAQSGDPRFYNIMMPMARHFMETQCYQTYDPADWMNGYSPAYSLHHRALDHYNQHYGEGIWYYYYLTGDERAKEIGLRAARSIRDAHIWGLNNPNARLAYQNASACLEAWKATGDESFLQIVRTYIKDRIFATQNTFGQIGGYSLEGGLEFTGAQTFMMALFADTAWKYLKEFPEEEALKEQVLLLADFTNQFARVSPNEEEYYNFWYSPTDPEAPRIFRSGTADDFVYWNGKVLIAGLYAYAYDLSGEDKYRAMGINLMNDLWELNYGNAFGFFAWGKASSQAMKNGIHAAAILSNTPTNLEEVRQIPTTFYQISPNPASQFIRLERLTEPTLFQIYSSNGQPIKSGLLQPGKTINIIDLPVGIYLLRIEEETHRFLKLSSR